jgi:hypothetical protein
MAKALGLDLVRQGTMIARGWPRAARALGNGIAVHNEFGCGYCRRKGGPEELRAFYDQVRRARMEWYRIPPCSGLALRHASKAAPAKARRSTNRITDNPSTRPLAGSS